MGKRPRHASWGARMTKDTEKSDWNAPKVDNLGRELIGKYPASGPARAIALHKAGLKSDPDKILTDEQIAAVNAGSAPAPITSSGDKK